MTTVPPRAVETLEGWPDQMRAWLETDPREGDAPMPPIPSPAWAVRRTLELPQSWRDEVIVADHAEPYAALGVTVDISQEHWFDVKNGGASSSDDKRSEPYVLVRCPWDDDSGMLGGPLADMERMAAAVLHAIALVKEAGR